MDKQTLKTKLKQQARNLAWRAITTVILTLVAVITFWVYASFVEPAVGPNDAGWDQDFSQNILGANNNDNDFSSSGVAFNPDGSIIEREEYIQMGIGTTTDASSMSTTLFAGQQYVADNMALASNYTSGRATKIDNLDATVSSRLAAASYTAERGTDNAMLASSYVTERGTDSAALASNYTSTRAGYLDRLARTCGNGVVELGEGCDDGGTSWTTGACAGDCSKTNYWSTPLVGERNLCNTTASNNYYCFMHGWVRSISVSGSGSGNCSNWETDANSFFHWKNISGTYNYATLLYCDNN